MNKKVIRLSSLALGVISALFMMYGLAKLAQAESTDPPVALKVDDMPGITISKPPDPEKRQLATTALAGAAVGLVVSGFGVVFSFRKRAEE